MSVGDVFATTNPSVPPSSGNGGGKGNAYDSAADLYGKAGEGYGGIASGNPIYESMNQYLNPYYDSVIADTKRGMTDQRNQDLMKVGDAGINSGAFGGSRHGLVESQVYSDAARDMSEMENMMRKQQFDTAAGLGAQDVGLNLQGLQGLMGLAGNLYGIGNDITDRQAGQGQAQQDLLNAILGGAGGQYNDWMNNPNRSLDLLTGVLGRDPRMGEGSSSFTPGLYDYLGLGAQMGGAYLGGKNG